MVAIWYIVNHSESTFTSVLVTKIKLYQFLMFKGKLVNRFASL